jgi:hypothetical protein
LPPYAPGCLPIIGHLLALASKEAPESLFLKWSKEVGPVFTLKFGIKRWVILNDSTSVNDLIVNRGTIYSSRDISSVMVQDVFDGGKCQALELKVYMTFQTLNMYNVESGGGFAFYPYGKCWRFLRRIGICPELLELPRQTKSVLTISCIP